MAEFRLTPRKKIWAEESTPAAEVDPQTFLGRVGSAAHTVGSILSTPSRLVHGAINYATGGEGGFGNLDPLDSTGGIEASRHLIRAGILPENDPSQWEIHDFTRGLADAIGDPTSWIGAGGLTKAGVAAANAGRLTKGLVPSIRAGERALINVRSPIGHVLGDLYSGPATADAIAGAGRAIASAPGVATVVSHPATKAVAGGLAHAGRVVRGVMSAPYEGVHHAHATPFMRPRFDAMRKAEKDLRGVVYRIGRQVAPLDEAAIASGAKMTPSQMIHSAVEGVTPLSDLPPELHKHVTELKAHRDNWMRLSKEHGVKDASVLTDLIGRDASGNEIHLGHAWRHTNPKIDEDSIVAQGSKKKAFKREQMLKGFTQGTYAQNGVNDVMKSAAHFALTDPKYLAEMDPDRKTAILHEFIRDTFGGKKLAADAVAEHVNGFVPSDGKTITLEEALNVLGHGPSALDKTRAKELADKVVELAKAKPETMRQRFGKIEKGATLTKKQQRHQDAIDAFRQQYRAAKQEHAEHLDSMVTSGARDILKALEPTVEYQGRRSVRKGLEKHLAKEVDPDAIRKIAIDTLPGQKHLTSTTDVLARYQMKNGKWANRHRELAKYVGSKNPEQLAELAEHGLFVNAPLADFQRGAHGAAFRVENAKALTDILDNHLEFPSTSKSTTALGEAAGKLGLDSRQLAMNIGNKKGIPEFKPNPHDPMFDPEAYTEYKLAQDRAIREMQARPVDNGLLKQIQFMKPQNTLTASGKEVHNAYQQVMNAFKSGILAFPSSRIRDLVSGAVQNTLHRLGIPGGEGYAEASRLMNGETLKNTHVYDTLADVKDWYAKTGLPQTPENTTEAMRQIAAVHMPHEHGILADLPGGQVGFTNEDILQNVPGQTKTTLYNRFVKEPMQAMTGASWRDWNPLKIRGVAGNVETTLPPVKASELFSAATDQLNRGAGFMHGVLNGAVPEVAGNRVNTAQVLYDPATYSPAEKFIKRNLVPFYSFQRGMLPTTAMQLADLGSPTSQLVKAQDRAYGGDPRVPDYVLDQGGLPLGRSEDGTMSHISGFGLMHEPSSKMIGQLANAVASGNAAPLAMNVASSATPVIVAPTEAMTGRSFSRGGEPLQNLESNSGRMLANLAAIARLRDKEAGPINYPGHGAVDFLTRMTPIDRLLGTLRSATDTRRGVGKLLTQEEPIEPGQAGVDLLRGVVPLTTGVQYTDISPSKQLMTVRGRAEEVAKQQGAREREEVYFPRASIERLRAIDPELAARQEALQRYINGLRLPKKESAEGEKKRKGIRLTAKSD